MGSQTSPTRRSFQGSLARTVLGAVLLCVSFIAVTHHIAVEPGSDDGAVAMQTVHGHAQGRTVQSLPPAAALEVATGLVVVCLWLVSLIVTPPVRRRIALRHAFARRGPPARLRAI